jgi:hypothetical protein
MLRRNRRAGLARPSGLPHFELYSRPLMSGFHTYVQQLVSNTAVRLKVEENQLVGIFGEIGVPVDGLKGA